MKHLIRLVALSAILAFFPGPTPLRADAPAAFTRITGVAAIGMTVRDLDRSIDFYTRVLSFEKIDEMEVYGEEWERLTGVFGCRLRIARLRLGDEIIELTQYMTPRGRAIPDDARANDQTFQHIAIVVRDMDESYAHLRAHNVEHASTAPQTLPTWNHNAAGIRAFYFRDPDGHFLEIIWFPGDKGPEKWHAPADRLFRGIDHTAIVVADADRALAFYRDTLGLRVVGMGENSGVEQEHLNNVQGARLRIVTLRASYGPGIELLDYLQPAAVRPAPPDTASNDLWHWHIILNADEATGASLSRTPGIQSPEPLIADLPEGTIASPSGVMIVDPDSHRLLVQSEAEVSQTCGAQVPQK